MHYIVIHESINTFKIAISLALDLIWSYSCLLKVPTNQSINDKRK